MDKKQIDYIFYIIHNMSDKGKMTVNFNDHSGDHDIDLYSINWYELRQRLEKTNLNELPDQEFCDVYGDPIEKDFNWNI